MVYGPRHPEKAEKFSSAELAAYARRTGERLVAELRRAESLSAQWADEEVGYALVSCAMDRTLARLAATGCWGKDNQLPSGEFWAVAGGWLEVSWLQHRARFKPRGYAGDFEMFERFWRRECVDHPLGRLFDRYFQGQAAVEAVRARTEAIGAALVECCLSSSVAHPFHIASVGCGPAIDLRCALDCLGQGRRELRVTLLDLDQAALDHAAHKLSSASSRPQINAVRENLYRLTDKPPAAALLAGADFLVCSGLFDYLPDDAALGLLKLFWKQLAPGGTLLVGNFAPHNPTRAYMEWIGNWYLIYRTADELARLGQTAGLPVAQLMIGAERLGIDLFLSCKK
ncbi:MAG: class I SAM-dependent methyltransferase [Pirellulales bacterium]